MSGAKGGKKSGKKFGNQKIHKNVQRRLMTPGLCMNGSRSRKTGSSRSMRNSSNSELIEKQRREEELEELKEYRSNLNKVGISAENKEVEKKLAVKPIETKSKFSQAKLLAGAVKHKSSESGNSVKRLKPDPDPEDKAQEAPSCVSLGSSSLSSPSIHCPSAAVCIGILPGLGAYSGSSDSESSSDSEGTINATGKIVSSIFRTNTFLEAP
uniref:PSME3-interacting protein isoform X2 n=1 Tax=Myodes glareolus TaxID=447135 RepID=UPI0020228419|nr:PSME3-interacting protein isoform X2 [Myodes glareolus]XP_048288363.1 PSME3-interacting protein isoform X2 [Myodes glareolus]